MYWKLVTANTKLNANRSMQFVAFSSSHRPIAAASEADARRRVLAALGWELDPVTREEFDRLEAESLAAGHGPAVSEACEPCEKPIPGDGSPCDGDPLTCMLKGKCMMWLLSNVQEEGCA